MFPFETDVFYRLPVLDFSPFDWREAGNMNLHKNVTSSGQRQGWRMELMFLLIHIITLVCNYCSQCREEERGRVYLLIAANHYDQEHAGK